MKKILTRNVLIQDSKEFEGEWVAVPKKDFEEARKKFQQLNEAVELGIRALLKCGEHQHREVIESMRRDME